MLEIIVAFWPPDRLFQAQCVFNGRSISISRDEPNFFEPSWVFNTAPECPTRRVEGVPALERLRWLIPLPLFRFQGGITLSQGISAAKGASGHRPRKAQEHIMGDELS